MIVVPNSRLILPSVAKKSDAAMGSSWLVGSSRIRAFGWKHHDRCKIQELLLPTRQLCDRLIKPRLDAEETCHFCNAAANRRRIVAEGFQPERQFVPDLIRDDLILRALLHKANLLGLFALGQHVEVSAVKKDFTVSASMRRKNCFELSEQCAFCRNRKGRKAPETHPVGQTA